MKKIKIITGCTLVSVGIIFALELLQVLNEHDNGFKRIFNQKALELITSFPLNSGGYYFAGTSSNHVYLANSFYKQALVETDYAITHLAYLQIRVKLPEKLFLPYERTLIDSNDIFITEGISPVMIRQSLYGDSDGVTLPVKSHFNLMVPLSKTSFIVRRYDSVLQQNILEKIKMADFAAIEKRFVLSREGNGFFSTDGSLLFDQYSGMICYVYRYRNEIDFLDPDLDLIYTSRSIDTIKTPELGLEKINSEGMITFSVPPKYVNKFAALSNKYLLIESGLKASNENAHVFAHEFIMDLYDNRTGQYLYSFYISSFHDEKIQNFVLSDSTILVLYENYLCAYRIK
ncbi:MAG TPA: hypothetical protein VK772_16275 [Puia sp.]|jgi:hypothetical protein|nr:hypothetical protein [Puia sp.]